MTEIVLVASYMKSGNTWMRAILQAMAQPERKSVDINALTLVSRWTSDRHFFERTYGLDPDVLTEQELLCLRPAVFHRLAAGAAPARLYLKTHEANIPAGSGTLFPRDLAFLTIHVVRHPYDVVVSLAAHAGISIDDAIAFMADPDAHEGSFNPAHEARGLRNFSQLPQRLLDWSGNVQSFLDQAPGSVLLTRYEDLLASPLAEVTQIAQFLGFPTTPADLNRVIEATRFSHFAHQEARAGFVERPVASTQFFRHGHSGHGNTLLTDQQKRTIDRQHGAVMHQLGYANDADRLPPADNERKDP
jgi:hypothetical protein